MSDDGASAAALFGTLTLSVVETAAPAGLTDCGLKAHAAPVGRFVHANVNVDLNPFCGVTVSARVPLLPAATVSDVADVSV